MIGDPTQSVSYFFRQDSEGRDLVFPFSAFGSGYVLSPENKGQANLIRVVMTLYVLIGSVLTTAGIWLGGMVSPKWDVLTTGLFLVLLVGYLALMRVLVHGLEVSSEPMDIGGLPQAKKGICFGFVGWLGALASWSQQKPPLLTFALFFFSTLFVIGYGMLYLRYRRSE